MPLGRGENAVFSMDCEKTGLNNNVVVCASSGGGKTMSIIEPRLLETHNTSLVVTVTKRKLVRKYGKMFTSRGYRVLDLNFAMPKTSNISYDPIRYISGYTDIRHLADSIINTENEINKNVDPYWNNTGASFLSALIAYVMMTKSEPCFSDVLELLDTFEMAEGSNSNLVTNLDQKFEAVAEKDSHCFAIACWNSFKNLSIKTAGCVYGVVTTAVSKVFSQELRLTMRYGQKIDFCDLANERTVLFITTSAVNPSLNCFVNIFYAQMFKQLFEYAESLPDAKLPLPVSVLCDDFATGSRIQNFPEYISVFREKQINVTLLLQSESQLEKKYGPEDAVTIINNCDTYIYMGGMDLKTCWHISERLNIPLEEVLYMPVGKVVIFRRGQKPIITERYNILENAAYKEINAQFTEREQNTIE